VPGLGVTRQIQRTGKEKDEKLNSTEKKMWPPLISLSPKTNGSWRNFPIWFFCHIKLGFRDISFLLVKCKLLGLPHQNLICQVTDDMSLARSVRQELYYWNAATEVKAGHTRQSNLQYPCCLLSRQLILKPKVLYYNLYETAHEKEAHLSYRGHYL
jgi:hypothetical protein